MSGMLKPVIGRRALKILDKNNEVVIVVADLHLGFEIELREKGLRLPSQTKRILRQLLEVVTSERCDRLIILGDVKHGILGFRKEEWEEVKYFLESLQRFFTEIEIVIGNHDGGLSTIISEISGVKIYSPRGVMLEDSQGRKIGLFHGHAWPASELFKAEILVMGHIHPSIDLRDELGFRIIESVWLKMKLDRENIARVYLKYKFKKPVEDPLKAFEENFNHPLNSHSLIVVPAFNSYLKGLSVNRFIIEESISPLLNSNRREILNSEIYLIDGTFLGPLKLFVEELRTSEYLL